MFGRKRKTPAAPVAAHFEAQLREAADMAITRARRAAPTGERWRVDVDDVLAAAHDHFGLAAIPPEKAGAALRARYELRAGPVDLDTDAYDGSH